MIERTRVDLHFISVAVLVNIHLSIDHRCYIFWRWPANDDRWKTIEIDGANMFPGRDNKWKKGWIYWKILFWIKKCWNCSQFSPISIICSSDKNVTLQQNKISNTTLWLRNRSWGSEKMRDCWNSENSELTGKFHKQKCFRLLGRSHWFLVKDSEKNRKTIVLNKVLLQ